MTAGLLVNINAVKISGFRPSCVLKRPRCRFDQNSLHWKPKVAAWTA